MSTARKLLWLRHASADQARQLQAAVPSMDLEKASKSWLPRPSPGRTAASWISFDGASPETDPESDPMKSYRTRTPEYEEKMRKL